MDKWKRKKISEEIPWVPLLLLTFILPIIGAGCSHLITYAVSGITDLGKMGFYVQFNAATVLVYFIITLINMKVPNKLKLNANTFAYLYATVTTATVYGCSQYPWHTFSRLIGARYIDTYGLAAKYMPSWWMISKEGLRAFMSPGPFNPEWISVILFWGVFAVTVRFLIIGFSLILRYQWYDIENLPFPYAQVALQSIRIAGDPSKPQTKKLLIGVLVGIIVTLPIILSMFFKWFPDIYQYHNPIIHSGEHAINLNNVMPAVYRSVLGLTRITDDPIYYALAFFMPINTLFSAAFFYIVLIIIGTQVVYYMGYYTGMENLSPDSRANNLRFAQPINVSCFTEHGILPATLIFAILLNYRNVILRPIRLAIGRGTESEKNAEKMEPVSYRTALIIIIVSIFIMLSLLTTSGFPIDDALNYIVISCILYQLAFARLRGYAGPLYIGAGIGPAFFRWKYPNVTLGNIPPGFYLYAQSCQFVTDTNAAFGGTAFPIFETWRVGTDLGANQKNLFKVVAITGIIAPFLGLLSWVWVGSAIGLAQTNRPSFWDTTSWGWPSGVYTTPAPPHIWPNIVAGFLLAGFLSFMRFRFAWWPLDPIGAILGTGGPGVKNGAGWVFLIVFIIKYIILKVGGSKTYTDTAIPFATGYLIGSSITGLIGQVIGVAVFFRPV